MGLEEVGKIELDEVGKNGVWSEGDARVLSVSESVGGMIEGDTWSDDDKVYVEGQARVLSYESRFRMGEIHRGPVATIESCYWCDNPAAIQFVAGCDCCNQNDFVCMECGKDEENR
jgi:hypothetical protein